MSVPGSDDMMDYFYTPPERVTETGLVIDAEEFVHLTHVMRKSVGDEIRVVDGAGTAYDVRIAEIRNKTAHCAILVMHPHHHEPVLRVTLAAGVLKNPAKFDFLVEKATELGVAEIVPLRTERTISMHARVDRWGKLALAAMKQSGRSFLPRVRELTTLDAFLGGTGSDWLKYIAHEEKLPGRVAVGKRPEGFTSAVILIGPEGGFSDAEVNICLSKGYEPLYLGERRLRTETAAIVAVALVVR